MADPDTRPAHVAIIMDGNGRWAQQRGQPRGFGHRAGGRAARKVIRSCWEAGVGHLTLFAFSTENWERPANEVGLLMDLFRRTLVRDFGELHDNDVRIRFIGDHGRFDPSLREEMRRAEESTAGNGGLRLNVAIGYGGRADLAGAVRVLAEKVQRGELAPEDLDEAALGRHVTLADQPEPDLFIRTGGEFRISNFLLWQLAYTELYFTDVLWPDFSPAELQRALDWYAGRERRFGQVAAPAKDRIRA